MAEQNSPTTNSNQTVPNFPSASSEAHIRILRLPEVMKRVGICRALIYQHMAAGVFPKSISLGARAVGWLEHEIDAWLTAKIQARGKNVHFLTDH